MPSSKSKTRSKKRIAVQAGQGPAVAEEGPDDTPVAGELLLAVAEQNLERVQECITRGDDPDATPLAACTPLILSIKLGNFEIVKVLVQGGARCCEKSENGMTLLHHAALAGHAEISRYLCKAAGVAHDQCNQAGCTPLYQAAQSGHRDCVKAFIDIGANPEARTRTGATPLYIASDRGNLDAVEVLLNAGCDANVRTQVQMTPLLVAAFNGHADVVRSLLAHDVDIEQHGPCGGTALYVAAQEGRRAVAELLLERGANVDATCDGQLTPSLIAAMQGNAEMVRMLLTARSDIGVRTSKGSTLAIMAARHGQTEVLKVLVEVAGACVFDDQNAEGLSALGLAKAGRHSETIAYIEKATAAQKEADLTAWEASLADILEDLETPMKASAKSKRSKRKVKVIGIRLDEESRCGEELCKDERIVLGDASVNTGSRDSVVVNTSTSHDSATNITAEVDHKLGSSTNEESGTAHCGDWLPVKRKGAKVAVATATPMAMTTTTTTSTTTRPTQAAPSSNMQSALSAVVEPKTRQMLAPMLSQIPDMLPSAPATPCSAQPSTPCNTTSPFGLPSPFGISGLWPPTPDPFGPHGSPGMWAALPPATLDAAPLILPESFQPFQPACIPPSFIPPYLPLALATFEQFPQDFFCGVTAAS